MIESTLLDPNGPTSFFPNSVLTRETLVIMKASIDARGEIPAKTVADVQRMWRFKDAAAMPQLLIDSLAYDYDLAERSVVSRSLPRGLLFLKDKHVRVNRIFLIICSIIIVGVVVTTIASPPPLTPSPGQQCRGVGFLLVHRHRQRPQRTFLWNRLKKPRTQTRQARHAPCSRVTRHTSRVTRHTSHVTRYTSRVTRHTSHCACIAGTCDARRRSDYGKKKKKNG